MAPTPINTEVNNPSQITPPLQWPRAKAGKQTLEIHWDFFAWYMLSVWKIPAKQALADFNEAKIITPAVLNEDGTVKVAAELEHSPSLLVAFCALFAASVAHTYNALGVDPPTPIYWAGVFEEGQIKECAAALREAMGKRQAEEEKKKAQTPLPLMVPEPANP